MGKINAKLFSLERGYNIYSGLKAIKIVSKKYNLLIMEDYLPVIGEIKGTITLIGEESSEELRISKGFYRHSHNEFELLIKDENWC